MPRALLFAVPVLGMFAVTALADDLPAPVPATAAPVTDPSKHTVVKGDTLWQIAGKYYDNAWLWPSLWEANKEAVADPNRIFPDQVLVIPDKGSLKAPAAAPETAAAPPEKAAEAQPAVTPAAGDIATVPATAASDQIKQEAVEEAVPAPAETPAVEPAEEMPAVKAAPQPATAETAAPVVPAFDDEDEDDFSAAADVPAAHFKAPGMVVGEKWKGDGVIAAEKDRKLLISAGDTVFVSVSGEKVRPGMTAIVYRRLGEVKDPKTRRFLGYEAIRVGKLQFTDIGPTASSARVLLSSDPLQIGDQVVLVEPEAPQTAR